MGRAERSAAIHATGASELDIGTVVKKCNSALQVAAVLSYSWRKPPKAGQRSATIRNVEPAPDRMFSRLRGLPEP